MVRLKIVTNLQSSYNKHNTVLYIWNVQLCSKPSVMPNRPEYIQTIAHELWFYPTNTYQSPPNNRITAKNIIYTGKGDAKGFVGIEPSNGVISEALGLDNQVLFTHRNLPLSNDINSDHGIEYIKCTLIFFAYNIYI